MFRRTDKPLSLRLRLGGGMAVLFLAGGVALYLAAVAFGRTAADRFYDRLLAGTARSVAETLIATPQGVDVDIPYSAFEMLSAAPEDRVFYRVFRGSGETITGYGDLPTSPLKPRPSAYRPDATFFTADYRGEPVRFVIVGRQLAATDASQRDAVWVEIGQTRHAHAALIRELVVRSVLPIMLMTVVALLLVWFGIGQALRPLKRIGDELTQRGPAELDPIRAPVPREVAPLVAAMDGFMERLATNIDTLRSFVGEAAHQLRTPLSALRAQAQVADRNDREDLGRSLDAVERNAARLTRLVNQMLSDATMSHRSDVRYNMTFDLADTLREVVHEATVLQGAPRYHLALAIEQAPMEGDALMLAEALRNIMDNARTHGTGPIEIAMSLDDEGDPPGYRIDIADRGPGLADDQKATAFQRFVRGQRNGTGAGLGLAIALQAVSSHRGTIALLDRPGGGLIARIILPGPSS